MNTLAQTTTQGMGLLSLMIFIPLIGAAILALIPREYASWHRYLALVCSVVTLIASISVWYFFSGNTYHFQFVESIPWIKSWGITYKLGIDGISLWLVLLTTFITVIAIWFSFYVKERAKDFMISVLVLETAMLGVFCALDLILFYVFFEATLIPMYILILVWGGKNRQYASAKFFLYTFLGSIFMLVAIVAIRNMAGTFDLILLQDLASRGELAVGNVQLLLFAAFALAFAVKVPMFPVHTWLPDAHTEAPTAGSIILAAVMLKMGAYGFLRFCLPLFPEATVQAAPFMMGLAVVGIIYGAIMAAVQTDWKRLVAYSSVSHLGFVMLGIFALNHNGITGGVLQSINHGISTGALFLMVGMIYERTHSRLFKDYSGLKRQMPMFAMLFLIIMLSSVGLPSMNGFIGEFLAMLGAFQAGFEGAVPLWMPIAAGAGVVLAAVYLLWMYQKVFYGPNDKPAIKRLRDIKPWEQASVWLLVVFIFWAGLYPTFFTQKMEASINAVRHQTLLPPGERPTWANKEIDINRNGDIVEALERDGDDLGSWTQGRVLVQNSHYRQKEEMKAVASR
ncbi:MAG: NADH-quinone oxidoreductase subunit M [Fimbriimonadales bacterium]|nr:NADH-quinone oxidoreductase subunit M [Fimbriimonadales bacterium]